jgi:hypothetical protein
MNLCGHTSSALTTGHRAQRRFIIIIISLPQSTAGYRPLQSLAISLDLLPYGAYADMISAYPNSNRSRHIAGKLLLATNTGKWNASIRIAVITTFIAIIYK